MIAILALGALVTLGIGCVAGYAVGVAHGRERAERHEAGRLATLGRVVALPPRPRREPGPRPPRARREPVG